MVRAETPPFLAVKRWSEISIAILSDRNAEEDFVGRSVTKTGTRPIIQEILDTAHVLVGDVSKAGPLGIKLPDQTIRVFVRAALMWLSRFTQVELDTGMFSKPMTMREFCAVVKRHTVTAIGVQLLQASPDLLLYVIRVLRSDLDYDRVT